jgi:hypothetical protein
VFAVLCVDGFIAVRGEIADLRIWLGGLEIWGGGGFFDDFSVLGIVCVCKKLVVVVIS